MKKTPSLIRLPRKYVGTRLALVFWTVLVWRGVGARDLIVEQHPFETVWAAFLPGVSPQRCGGNDKNVSQSKLKIQEVRRVGHV